ncbi:MAG: molybdopterin converting factor subunit 1 [Chloroflexota bacterium]|nr:molybdopterin converting factor subunit 1 [Chloroflexota bacterium]
MRTEQMKITVKFFAAPRQALGTGEIEVAVPAGSTVEELLDHLVKEYPALDSYVRSLKVAVNRTYADKATVLQDGDEVACLPPVGGG